MGRIKSTLVKRSSFQMMKTEGLFTEGFEANKKALGNNTMPSKKMRNKIAGFMARRIKEAKKPVKKKPVEIDIYDKERFSKEF